jgi:UDP-2-acetamido-3-amino-2,3-dideoxy-glucuronate N-acetyltransferase
MFIHPLADVQSENIGENTRVWQFCVVLPEAIIGEDCNICFSSYIENQVKVGNQVTIKNGVHLCDGVTMEDLVFIGPNTTFTNNNHPRSKEYVPVGKTLVKRRASIGAGCVILCGITIGENAMIGAGSVVCRDVPDNELWMGNPARFIRKLSEETKRGSD